MKISDPLGKVYSHTMFRRRSYDMHEENEASATPTPDTGATPPPPLPPHGNSNRSNYFDSRRRSRSRDRVVEEEDEDRESIASDRSEDSLSTKSSRIVGGGSSRRLGSRRGTRGMSSSRGEERDREDAISFASRASRNSTSRKSVRRHTGATGTTTNASAVLNASMRSKGGSLSSSKKYPPESLGPPGTSYSLWSASHSLKREHKRKFNRSLCGVLLGVSIVLVILGILGIIGIAVYLGVVQKLDGDGEDMLSVDGAIRVVSDEFSISLLNPSSELYKSKAEKYSNMLSNTYKKSYLKKAFVRTSIDGFSPGSVRVFFKIVFDKKFLPTQENIDVIEALKDILVQEIMNIENSEFEGEAIDMDNIAFAKSKAPPEEENSTSEEHFFQPEPYQQEQKSDNDANSNEETSEKSNNNNNNLWQNLMDAPRRSGAQTVKPDISTADTPTSTFGIATDRMDIDDGIIIDKQAILKQANTNLMMASPYPMFLMNSGGAPSSGHDFNHNNPTESSMMEHGLNHIKNNFNTFTPNLVPSVPDPRRPTPVPHIQQPSVPMLTPQMSPSNSQTNMDEVRRKMVEINPADEGLGLMSPFLWPPPPQRSWSETNSFVPSRPVTDINRSSMNIVPGPQASVNHHDVRVVVTSTPSAPNVIPVGGGGGLPSMTRAPITYQQHQQMQQPFKPPQPQQSALHEVTTPKLTAQQILHQQMLNKKKAMEMEKNRRPQKRPHSSERHDDQVAEPSSDDFWLSLQANSKIQVQNDHAEISDLHSLQNLQQDIPKPASSLQKPRIQFEPEKTTKMTRPQRNQFMPEQDNSIEVFNPGASGLQVVEASVPVDQNTNFFKLGGSMVVGGPESLIQPEVGVYPAGEDSHIIHASQIPAGTPIPQGPHGPIVPTPRPTSFAVTQTPNAPQVVQNMGSTPGSYTTPSARGGFGPGTLIGSNQQGGPGNYNPPLEKSPTPRPGTPGSGQQLIKKFLLQQQQQDLANQNQQMMQQQKMQQAINNQAFDQRQGQQQHAMMQQAHFASQKDADIQDSEVSASEGIRRQDVADIALGAISKGLAPMSIFSNLLNAYATLDNKHDITGKLMKTATQWFNPNGEEDNSENIQEPKTTENITTERSTEGSTSTSTSTFPTSTTGLKKIEENEDYYYDDDERPFQAEVMDSARPSLVRSNVSPDQPLRPKPPVSGIFRVTPSPGGYNINSEDSTKTGNNFQYGVSNPHYFSAELPTRTEGYGPNDFIVETVKLDKAFLHQFFTSKPLLLDNEDENSKSGYQDNNFARKRGRINSDEDELPVHPEELLEPVNSKLAQMVKEHQSISRQEFVTPLPTQYSTTTTISTSSSTTTTTTTTTSSTTPRMTSTSEVYVEAIMEEEEKPILETVKTFKRYHIPAEVKISHSIQLPKAPE